MPLDLSSPCADWRKGNPHRAQGPGRNPDFFEIADVVAAATSPSTVAAVMAGGVALAPAGLALVLLTLPVAI